MSTLGQELEALDEESAQLPLSKEDYLTLRDRHAELVQDLRSRCRELTVGRHFAALQLLNTDLTSLQGLDLSALVQPQRGILLYVPAFIFMVLVNN